MIRFPPAQVWQTGQACCLATYLNYSKCTDKYNEFTPVTIAKQVTNKCKNKT